jgi:uncharacterized Fe-S cluster-containing protein
MNMNDYDLFRQLLNRGSYGKSSDSIWMDEVSDMAYSYSRGYYNTTRSDEVAAAVLEAYSRGVEFETLIKKNKTVRQYWYQIQSEKAKAEQSREREKIRLAKLAEKRAEEKAKREEVMSKLSREELEAFGFVKKGKR